MHTILATLLPDAGGPVFAGLAVALFALVIIVPILIIAAVVILIVVLTKKKKGNVPGPDAPH